MSGIWKQLVTAVFFIFLAGVISLGLYLPLVKHMPSFVSDGTVVAQSRETQAGKDRFSVHIRLQDGTLVEGNCPSRMMAALPVGRRVTVQCQRTGFPPFVKTFIVRQIHIPAGM